MGTPQVVVVTGASAGVGRAIVHQFARAGWRIGLIARDAEALEEVKREVEELGGSAVIASADVANADAIFAAADSIENTFVRAIAAGSSRSDRRWPTVGFRCSRPIAAPSTRCAASPTPCEPS
jgi:NADP-dependent 3-hydroxy acid dehydrogenase YdfG